MNNGAVIDAVRCTGVVKIYETRDTKVHAVRGVDFRIPSGILVGVTGPSGSGKSTLMRMISGLTTPTAGQINVANVDLMDVPRRRRRMIRNRLVVHVEQHPPDNLVPHLNVRDQLLRTAMRRGGDVDAITEVLTSLRLDHRVGHFPEMLSGGEQQRLAFARAIVSSAVLIVADEPTAELDEASTEDVLETARMFCAAGGTVVMASHDPQVVDRLDLRMELRDGAIASLTRGDDTVAVIDGSDRLQLPPEIRARFNDTARLRWDGDHLRVEAP